MSEILMEMTVNEARAAKDMAGRETLRPGSLTEGFVGNPILEAHDEGLDGINYSEYALQRNHDGSHAYTLVCRAMYHGYMACVFMARALWCIREKKKPSAEVGKMPVAGME